MKNYKIISYNVNGIRSAINKGLIAWLAVAQPDIFCVQELKAEANTVDLALFEQAGYNYNYIHTAIKKGYSGVGIFSKIQADHIQIGCGIERYDNEGRVIRADYGDLSIMSCYFPSGSSSDERQQVKFDFLRDFFELIQQLRKQRKKIIIVGDYNICHEEIDIHDPKANKDSSGFLPEERKWMSDFFASGFIDTFRTLHPDPNKYTWWSFRAGARPRNKGWRIDYQSVTENLKDKIVSADILMNVVHSDHCPTELVLKVH